MNSKSIMADLPEDSSPDQVSVTMYDVGFGDCFRLTFAYPGGIDRHILIDCGSTSVRKAHMQKVVDQIALDCGGKLDAVVATHRHKDHISAFGLKGVGDTLAALKPEVVIQPWTEHPMAEEGALEAPEVFSQAARQRIMGLRAAQKLAWKIVRESDRLLAAAGSTTKDHLEKIASLSVRNKKAILNLTGMAKEKGRYYVHAGGESGLEEMLPGVRVTVLGPPTLTQTEGIRKQKRWDEDEFWKLHLALAGQAIDNPPSARGESLLFPEAKTRKVSKAPSFVKWVIDKLDRAQQRNVQRIVTALDDAMNNTSVILLFEIGGKALLFSGDAQLENWQYALSKKSWTKLLKKTTLYKVGHHGSTNATPQSLWKLFENRGEEPERMHSLLSTHHGHHNKVPRKTLVKALKAETNLHNSEKMKGALSETYII